MSTSLPSGNRLYTITDCTRLHGDQLLSRMQQVLAGGCQIIQYRDKSDERDRRLNEARDLQKLCRRYDSKLLINDDIDLAQTIGADGVHLGQGDTDIATARQLLGARAIIGSTCHADLTLAEHALRSGASYIAFGRFFSSSTKPDAPPAPLSLLSQARHRWPEACIVAIGGITQDTTAKVIEHGANFVAICQDVCHHPNPQAYARAFAQTAAA